MREVLYCVVMAGLLAEAVLAGQIYGSVTEGGRGVTVAGIEIDCAGAVTRGTTASDGSYRLNVPQQGRCMFTVTIQQQRGSVVVFSYPNPSQYDFEVRRRPNGSLELKRR